MIALLDGGLQAALDERRRIGQDRRAGGTRAEGLAGDPVALLLGRLEERERHRPLPLAEDVQREGLRLLDEPVRVRVGLDTDHDQRRLERGLGHPVHGGGCDPPVPGGGGQDVEAIGDHAKRGLLGVGVHRAPPLGDRSDIY